MSIVMVRLKLRNKKREIQLKSVFRFARAGSDMAPPLVAFHYKAGLKEICHIEKMECKEVWEQRGTTWVKF